MTNDAVEVAGGVTLIEEGDFHGAGKPRDTLGSLTLLNLAVINHTQGRLTGLTLGATGTVDLRTGSKIDVSARGLRGAYRDGNAAATGETYIGSGSVHDHLGRGWLVWR